MVKSSAKKGIGKAASRDPVATKSLNLLELNDPAFLRLIDPSLLTPRGRLTLLVGPLGPAA
jgi:hypothetical protein